MVVAEPRAPRVERGHESVRVREALQGSLRARRTGEEVSQRPADAVQERRAQQQLAHLRRLALQHLRQQVPGDGPLAAGELPHEPLGLGVPRERDRRQAQTGCPALGAIAEKRHPLVRKRGPAGLQQLARLLGAEAEIVGPNLGQRAGEAQVMQAKLRLLARRQDDPECRRDACQEPLEQTKRVGGVQLVQIVDDQHNRILEQRQIGQQLVDQRFAGEARCRSHTPDRPIWAGRRQPVDDGQPETLGVVLVARDRHPGGPLPGELKPRAQQHGLATARRRADQRQPPRRGRLQPLEELPALHCRNRRPLEMAASLAAQRGGSCRSRFHRVHPRSERESSLSDTTARAQPLVARRIPPRRRDAGRPVGSAGSAGSSRWPEPNHSIRVMRDHAVVAKDARMAAPPSFTSFRPGPADTAATMTRARPRARV